MKDFMNWFPSFGKQGEGNPSNSPFGNGFPNQMMDMFKMNEFVQKQMEEALSPNPFMQQPAAKEKEKVPYKVIELVNEVVVTITVPLEVAVEELRLTVGNGKLFVDGVGQERLAIALPAQTSRRNIHAQYHEGIVEVRLPKRHSDEKEIFLRY
ncbi:Hsp20/alpha crystallin family protein [Halobacillus sp. ACCC02827]|uniref:Hsp20/alpha crystallin family protein n=1 Tax=Bacillaceae TaxID=186817 RepID=UPI0002A4EE66|nr:MULTISPECIES: Hsp20/alpha crystallin family protein [Bacillaceae]ELK49082.1 hypothetical protein D479_00600 [Halobacillus sp. BAB-2008]QHT48125.1 hypothetical protein M662_17105 [Bacillus sp. SB49]WJE15359.1 Hsp20/alpha crystallin family protein [Halobacillus sp. ACCC02827]